MLYKPPTMRGVLTKVALLVLGAGLSAAACSGAGAEGGDTSPRGSVKVGPSLVFPRGVFDSVRKLTLTVYDTNEGTDCAADGTATGPTGKPIATKDLRNQGCGEGIKFCGELQIGQSDATRVFQATGFNGEGDRVAIGCSKAVVNQDAVPVEIRMRRFIKAALCGNGIVEPNEQCEPPDPGCTDACHTEEVYLSDGPGRANTTAPGKPNEKKNPVFLWPSTSGDPGRFVAFFGDDTPDPTEVTARVLSDSFGPYTKGGPEMGRYSFFLPNNPSAGFPPAPEPGNQFSPAAGLSGGKYYVVYQDDLDGNPDIHLRSMDALFQAEQPSQMPIRINGTSGGSELGSQTRPAMALGIGGLFFIAWEDASSGRVRGRTFNPANKALGARHDVSGANSHAVSLAALGTGWVATWESGSDVKMRLLGPDGTPAGSEQTVNDGSHSGQQVHPVVASLPDGRFAIVWTDSGRKGGDVFVQRYAAGATRIAGDQLDPINDIVSEGPQNEPTITSSSAVGGSYVAGWVDANSGHVRARFIGGTEGFLFNHVDGQETEFQASVGSGRARRNPAMAVGGAGPFVAIGWEDTTNDAKAGIYGRRLPVGE